jgi:hypothetical protein
MSAKKKKKHNPKRRAALKPAKGRIRALWIALIAAGAVVAASLLLFYPEQTEIVPVQEPADQDAAVSNTKVDVQKLVGRWLRPDGGYILDIRAVGTDGVMEAAYLNPQPIHVAQAKVSYQGSTVEVFIELRDRGYPGSTYTLYYNPDEDTFSGVYFQAAMGQKFQVGFVRTD